MLDFVHAYYSLCASVPSVQDSAEINTVFWNGRIQQVSVAKTTRPIAHSPIPAALSNGAAMPPS